MDRPSYIIKLDMIDNGTVSTGIRLKQGDAGIALYLRIYNNGNPYYDANEVPTVYFKRPDGSSVFGSAQTGYDNMYVYVIAGNELQSAGTVIMDVKFTFAAGRESSASCTIECVQDTLADKVTGSAIYWNDAQKILDDLSKAITNAQTIEAQLQQAIIEAPELIEELGLDNYTLLTDFGSHTGNDVIHADADGNVASASKLQVARKINGVDFDGSEDIEIDVEKNAQDIGYSNSSSGLVATNVQSAIDEVNDKFDVDSFTYSNATSNIKGSVKFYGKKSGNVVTIAFSFVKTNNTEASFKIPYHPSVQFNFACSSNSASNWSVGGIRPDGTVYVLSSNNSEMGVYSSISFVAEVAE